MELKDFLEFLTASKELKPLVEEGVKSLGAYIPMLKKMIYTFCDGSVDLQMHMIERYKKKGLSQEQAVMLICNQMVTITKNLNKPNGKK